MQKAIAALIAKADLAGLARLLADPDPERQEAAWGAMAREPSPCAREAVCAALRAEDAPVRARAVTWLAKHAGAGSGRLIAPLVADADPSVRRTALRALAGLGEEALPDLARGLRDADAALRRIAAESIARHRGPAAIEPLLAASEDAEPAVRRIAMRALSTRDDARIGPRALRGLFDADLPARGSAFAFLLRLDFARRTELVLAGAEEVLSRSLFASAEDLGAVFHELPVEQLERFVAPSMAEGSPLTRAGIWPLARDEMARRGDARCAEVLRRAALEGSGEFRSGCLRALRLADSPDAERALVFLLDASETPLRLGVLSELAARLTPPCVAAITRALGDGEVTVRVAALRALRKKPPADWLDRLLSLVHDGAAEVRRLVVDELGALSAPAAKEALVSACADEDADVRRVAVRRLVGRSACEPRLVPTYLAALAWPFPPEDDDWGGPVRQKIVGWLGELGVKDALPVLAQVANEDRILLRRMAVEAILKIGGPEALKSLYRGPTTEAVEAAAEEPAAPMDLEEAKAILAKLANLDDPNLILDPRARDALAAFRDTPDKSVLRKVALGLGRAGDPRGLVPLIRALEECRGTMVQEARKLIERYPEAKTLTFLLSALKMRWRSARRWAAERMRAETDPRGLDPLLEAMSDEDSEVQCAVVAALANHTSDPRVIDKLLACVSYGDVSVRQAAIEALGEAQVKAAVPAIVAALTNPFLRARGEEALRRIGDRKGILAVKRMERREALFPKGRKAEEERRRRMKPKGKPKP